MTIAILGTRGIPNNYGGFEQFAEYLSKALVNSGHKVTVFNSHNHPYQSAEWNKVQIVHKFDPEFLLGSFGQFIYDFNSILYTRKENFDIILQLGYTSSSIWSFLFPKKSIVVTNMDGLEWKRTKYSRPVRKFLKYAEYLAATKSDFLVADSLGIKGYLTNEYGLYSEFIPYGAHAFTEPDHKALAQYNLEKYSYDMLIARMEPENNIEPILDGVVQANSGRDFLVIGRTTTPFGKYLRKKFQKRSFIRFLESIYDLNVLNNLRHFSNLYFHGHSVGGTNPSLLEAMASNSLICAHRNPFNMSILGDDAYFFEDDQDVADILKRISRNANEKRKIDSNFLKIVTDYNWAKVIEQYEKLFVIVLSAKRN